MVNRLYQKEIATGENYQLSFNIILGIGNHTICPDPN